MANGFKMIPAVSEFFYADLEPITESLIGELGAIPSEDLRVLAAHGFNYCRSRNSFINVAGFINVHKQLRKERV